MLLAFFMSNIWIPDCPFDDERTYFDLYRFWRCFCYLRIIYCSEEKQIINLILKS